MVNKITTRWFDDSKQAILWTFEQGWTVDDLRETYKQTNEMCYTVDHWVNAIVDLSTTSFPSFIATSIKNASKEDPPNYDMAVIVTTNMFVQVMTRIFNGLPYTKDKFTVRSTLDDAVAFVKERQAKNKDRPIDWGESKVAHE